MFYAFQLCKGDDKANPQHVTSRNNNKVVFLNPNTPLCKFIFDQTSDYLTDQADMREKLHK